MEMRDGAGERGNRAERKGRACPLPPFPPCKKHGVVSSRKMRKTGEIKKW